MFICCCCCLSWQYVQYLRVVVGEASLYCGNRGGGDALSWEAKVPTLCKTWGMGYGEGDSTLARGHSVRLSLPEMLDRFSPACDSSVGWVGRLALSEGVHRGYASLASDVGDVGWKKR